MSNLVRQVLERLKHWVETVGADISVHGAYVFGSLIHREGIQFGTSSDIDLVFVVPPAADSPIEVTRWLQALSRHKQAIESELGGFLQRPTGVPICSIVAATRTEIGADIHKDAPSGFFTENEFCDLLNRENRLSGLPGAGTARIEDRLVVECLRFVQKKRNAYLSLTANGAGGLGFFDEIDPVPKDIMRHAAMANQLHYWNATAGSEYDTQYGLDFLCNQLFELSKTDPLYQSVHEKTSVRRGARGKRDPLSPTDQILLAEIVSSAALLKLNTTVELTGQKVARQTSFVLPEGWSVIDRPALAKIRRTPPVANVMAAFFDGDLPTWRTALATGVQPRAIVDRLVMRLRAVHTIAPAPRIVLLKGAGGEGKSTAILQAAAALVEDSQDSWLCLHRRASAALVSEDLLARLPKIRGTAWVVVIDDADNAIESIRAAIKQLAPRTDVHLLLAARDLEWQTKAPPPTLWYPDADFKPEPLEVLTHDDAARIVAGWKAWGDEGMGRLKDATIETASDYLFQQAHELAARREEGSLLGALLIARQGEDIIGHVRTLIRGIGRDPVIGRYSLRSVYMMIAAMHAENQLYLTRAVLADALNTNFDELESKMLGPLRTEAKLDAGNSYVLTRHRSIAEAACSILREEGEDINAVYPFLAGAAQRYFRHHKDVDLDSRPWTLQLANHFVEKDEIWWNTARTIAKAIFDADSENDISLTILASVLRRTDRAVEAMVLLKANGHRCLGNRSILQEWSAIARTLGDFGLSAWLGGRSLADNQNQPLDPRRCKRFLLSLADVFADLKNKYHDACYAVARAACGRVGVDLPQLDVDTRHKFEDLIAEHTNIETWTIRKAIDAIGSAVVVGSGEFELENDLPFFDKLLGDPEIYKYGRLARMTGGYRKVAN